MLLIGKIPPPDAAFLLDLQLPYGDPPQLMQYVSLLSNPTNMNRGPISPHLGYAPIYTSDLCHHPTAQTRAPSTTTFVCSSLIPDSDPEHVYAIKVLT